jgi:hypothetical protein
VFWRKHKGEQKNNSNDRQNKFRLWQKHKDGLRNNFNGKQSRFVP